MQVEVGGIPLPKPTIGLLLESLRFNIEKISSYLGKFHRFLHGGGTS